MTEYQQQLVNDNINLVYELTKKYYKKQNYEDIVAEGMLALCKAACLYKESFGNKFSTFAYIYIRGKCLNYINRDLIVKPSRHDGVFSSVTCVDFSADLEKQYSHSLTYANTKLDEDIMFDIVRAELTDTEYIVVSLMYSGYTKKEIQHFLHQNQLHEILVLLIFLMIH